MKRVESIYSDKILADNVMKHNRSDKINRNRMKDIFKSKNRKNLPLTYITMKLADNLNPLSWLKRGN